MSSQLSQMTHLRGAAEMAPPVPYTYGAARSRASGRSARGRRVAAASARDGLVCLVPSGTPDNPVHRRHSEVRPRWLMHLCSGCKAPAVDRGNNLWDSKIQVRDDTAASRQVSQMAHPTGMNFRVVRAVDSLRLSERLETLDTTTKLVQAVS